MLRSLLQNRNVSILPSRHRSLSAACSRLLAAFIAVSLAFLAPYAQGQLETGSILGVVKDSTGAVVAHSHVSVVNVGTGAVAEVTGDDTGNFVAPVLPLGTYRVMITAAGFKQSLVEGVQLAAAERKRIDVVLAPGAATESITVTSEAPLLQTASSELGTTISSEKVHDLPLNGRDVGGLLALLPGLSGANTNYFQSSIAFTVDGTDASQIDSGFIGAAYNSDQRITRTSLDAVEEVQIQTSNFSAQWGQSNGAIFNIVTKSGTNNFHGSAFEYLRNENTDARNYFNTPPLVKPQDRVNQFGGSIGGPILKNRLFFFGNYEGVRQVSGVTYYNALVPTAAFRATLPAALQPVIAQLPLPNGGSAGSEPRLGFYNETTQNHLTENSGSVKVDYQLTPNDKISARWNGNQSTTADSFGVAQGQVRDVQGLLQTARVAYTKVITPNLYNEASVALNRMRYIDGSSNIDAIRTQPLIFSIGNGATGLGPALFDIRVGNTSFTYLDTLSWVKGKHQMKFGVQFIRNQQNKVLNFQRDMLFLTLDQLAANNPFFIGTLGYPTTGIRLLYSNGFVQDDVQVTPALTLNLGLRYTYDTPPGEAHNRLENYNPATGTLDPQGTTVMSMPATEFAPRVGFAYKPWERGRTVVRGAAGLFYNDFNVAQSQELLDNWAGQSRTVFDYQDPTITGFPFPPNLAQTSVPNIWGVSKQGWKNSHSYQWNLAVQQEFGKSSSFQLAYVGNVTNDLSPYFDVNRLNLQGVRPNPNFGTINIYRQCCNANYNGLQATLRERLSKGLTLGANYAWSRSMDHGGATFGSSTFQDDQNLRAEYGPADYDQRHYFETDFNYQVPAPHRLPSWAGGGWQFNGIVTAHSGLPYTVVCGCDSGGTGDGVGRPNAVPGIDPHVPSLKPPYVPQANIAAFSEPAFGTFGDVRRNSMYGPRFVNADLSLFKNFRIREQSTLQLRLEDFNAFNHPNFFNPDANINGDPNFGKSLGASTARQLQFAARFDF